MVNTDEPADAAILSLILDAGWSRGGSWPCEAGTSCCLHGRLPSLPRTFAKRCRDGQRSTPERLFKLTHYRRFRPPIGKFEETLQAITGLMFFSTYE